MDSPNLGRAEMDEIGRMALHFAEGTHRVLIILMKAPMEVSRVTMCARPVQESVTVMTGQENARNSSKEENQ